MKNVNRVISARKSFQGAWVISIQIPDNTFTELQFFGYTKKAAMKLAKGKGLK